MTDQSGDWASTHWADVNNASGVWTETTSTPEPSSLALMGMGVLGVVGVLKRRMGN